MLEPTLDLTFPPPVAPLLCLSVCCAIVASAELGAVGCAGSEVLAVHTPWSLLVPAVLQYMWQLRSGTVHWWSMGGELVRTMAR